MRCGCGECRSGHVGGTCGSGIVSSAADVIWMSVVCLCLVLCGPSC